MNYMNIEPHEWMNCSNLLFFSQSFRVSFFKRDVHAFRFNPISPIQVCDISYRSWRQHWLHNAGQIQTAERRRMLKEGPSFRVGVEKLCEAVINSLNIVQLQLVVIARLQIYILMSLKCRVILTNPRQESDTGYLWHVQRIHMGSFMMKTGVT